jgi:two-component system chemotaxis sensor kinase CheA
MISRKDVHYTQGRPVVFRDNSTVYVENIDWLLAGRESGEFPDPFLVFISEHQNRKIGWCVDELVGERQIMLKNLGEPLSRLSCYSGATVLGKGELVPVLDLEQLYKERYQ